MKKQFLFTAFAAFMLSIAAFSQDNLSAPAPIDPEIRMGKLDNGLTYFIRKNKEPEKRASYYIIQNVGAILENDDQNGLAHFLEHMAFNGTKHFPGKGIINFLERHGVAFGENINAGTSWDETVYNLSDVPVDAPGITDSCLLVLNDWSHYLLLTDKEIDLERGVIEEEWRTRTDASRRMFFDVIAPVIFKGSKYAERNVSGNLEVIKSFPYNALREYYKKWYRPDLQAIAIVGDIDVNEVEKKVKALFSQIPAPQNPAPRPDIEVPFHSETYFVVAQDKEAPGTSISVTTLQNAVKPDKKNKAYLRDDHVISLMNSMMNVRISELLQKPNPPFISGSVSFGSYLRNYDAFSIDAEARKNEEGIALESIYTEAERAKRFGFTDGELKRAKATMLSSYESRYRQKDKISNDAYISGIQEYYLNGEPLTSMDFDYEFLKQVIDGITVDEVNAKLRSVMKDENRSVIITGLEGNDVKHLTEQEALGILEKVKNSTLTPYTEQNLGESLISKELKGSKIVKTVPLPLFDAVEWTLANNARVIYRKASYEKDNVLLSSFSFGGISRLDKDLVLPANLLSSLASFYGVGDYDNVTLQKMLAGKKASVTTGLSETTEAVSGSSTVKDFETMMQLLYLKFAEPRFDSAAHNAIIGRYTAMLANMESDPAKIKSDSISLITTDHNPRTPLMTKETVGRITLNEVRKIYKDRFNAADEFTFFIVGNIGQDTVMQMVEKYIGSLPSAGRKETWIDRKIEQPDGKVTREITLPLKVPKATVFLAFANDMKYKPENYLGLEVIKGILDIVFVDKVREEEGGTYGVGTSLGLQKRPEEKAQGMINFDCDPARAADLKAIIYRELNNLMEKGPSQENLDKAVNNLLKTREENKLHNSYWLSTIGRFYSYGINSNDPANYENVLKAFTVKDIKKIASKMFGKADVVDLVFKPAQ
jgi:zinc protease